MGVYWRDGALLNRVTSPGIHCITAAGANCCELAICCSCVHAPIGAGGVQQLACGKWRAAPCCAVLHRAAPSTRPAPNVIYDLATRPPCSCDAACRAAATAAASAWHALECMQAAPQATGMRPGSCAGSQ